MDFLLALAGCVLGFIGWQTARRARADVTALRTLLMARQTAELPPDVLQPEPGTPAAPAFGSPAVDPIEPAPPPEMGSDPEVVPEPRPKVDIELLLTQRWGVWLGAVALLLSAAFLVRVAVQEGWVGTGPTARCLLAAALGVLLVGGAAWLRRRPSRVLPFKDQAPAALAAGGVAMLFAAAYGAGPLYGLVPNVVAFGLLGAAALAGIGLSLEFGPLVGAIGLVAAFGTPLLVQTDQPSWPGLFAYLLAVSAACWGVAWRVGAGWMGWGAVLGGAIWVLAVVAGPTGDVWAAGLFVPAAVALGLWAMPMTGRWTPLLAGATAALPGLAGVALAAATGDAWVRLGVLLLAPVAMTRAARAPRLAWVPMVAAGLSVLVLLVWAVPSWHPTGEAITIDGAVAVVLPGAWLPGAVLPLLQTAALVALLHALAGLWGERRSAAEPAWVPLAWASLTAAAPVAVLGVVYAQVGRLQGPLGWAALALLLAAALVAAAAAATRSDRVPLGRAGVHAAGAVAALALGCAILLDAEWLTVSLALLVPGLAWIERWTGLRALRHVALAAAGVVLARLVLNPWVLSYDFGSLPVLNLLLVAYGIPAACFAAAAWMFRRDGDGLVVAVLEAGACLFAALLVLLEVHHAVQGGVLAFDSITSEAAFAEVAWDASGLGLLAVLLQRLDRRPALRAAWRVVGAAALFLGVGLLVLNPLIIEGELSDNVVLNALWPAYLVPAVLAMAALARRPRRLLAAYGLLALLMFVTAMVLQAFDPGAAALEKASFTDAELWSLSAAWLALAAAVMTAGFVLRRRDLRLVGLGLVALVTAKVFLVDMSGLDGLWRVLSFLGLGLSLIGLGSFYRRVGARAP